MSETKIKNNAMIKIYISGFIQVFLVVLNTYFISKENRNFIGFEIEEKHVNTSNKRIELIKSKPQLF